MIVRESIQSFKRGIGSKESLGVGIKTLIPKWLDEYMDDYLEKQPSFDQYTPFTYKIDHDTLSIKLAFNSKFHNRLGRFPDYILDNLDPRSMYNLGIKSPSDHEDLIKKSLDTGFKPSPSSIKKDLWQIKDKAGEDYVRKLILSQFSRKLPNDLLYVAKNYFSKDEIKQYFDNPEFFVDKDLRDRDESERNQDYEQAEMNLNRAGFYIGTTERQRKNGTINAESPTASRTYTISIGGRMGQKGTTGSLYNNPEGTYVDMAQILIDKSEKEAEKW